MNIAIIIILPLLICLIMCILWIFKTKFKNNEVCKRFIKYGKTFMAIIMLSIIAYMLFIYSPKYNYGIVSSSSEMGSLRIEYWKHHTAFMKILVVPPKYKLFIETKEMTLSGFEGEIEFNAKRDGIEVIAEGRVLLKMSLIPGAKNNLNVPNVEKSNDSANDSAPTSF